MKTVKFAGQNHVEIEGTDHDINKIVSFAKENGAMDIKEGKDIPRIRDGVNGTIVYLQAKDLGPWLLKRYAHLLSQGKVSFVA